MKDYPPTYFLYNLVWDIFHYYGRSNKIINYPKKIIGKDHYPKLSWPPKLLETSISCNIANGRDLEGKLILMSLYLKQTFLKVA